MADKEIELLNKNFNSMIKQLKQEKLVISESWSMGTCHNGAWKKSFNSNSAYNW